MNLLRGRCNTRKLRTAIIGTCLCHRALSSLGRIPSCTALKIAVVTGSTRTSGPPSINGPRIASFVRHELEERGNTIVAEIDPRDFPLLEKPEFAHHRRTVPKPLREARAVLEEADAYVCITPEYNHAPSPGLVNVLNHFGSSVFSFKPSAIVSYSAGQWGGTRAAIALRPILSELGALPVSAMIHIPNAQDAIDDDGTPTTDPKRWKEYCGRCFSQLEWWADAAKNHKEIADPFEESKPFRLTPSQRNAPKKQ
ncbi:unnamed protein product [Pseudo-nitzschia multistriata]|uniref:NADPH-dependent FMN reductase-like domain-containing protein n=1 Tax=Pseudo-nitzschia multistriata TaxID=183589 RepID=A0A448YWZ3_9STRA|nr:unnamed protein product [Pseudo-nitzschia multistriata]